MPALPKRPTFGWDNFADGALPTPVGIDALPHRLRLTSGRAALWAATQALGLPPGSRIGVPSFHCPTLIAPLRLAGLTLVFYPLDGDGLPRLASLDRQGVQALVVPQLFGLPRSLAAVRAWCDAEGVQLIEDCAHSFFGPAGERPVGHWGDVATASLSKFFPVTEGGLLAAARALPMPSLRAAGLKAQLKAGLDVLERAVEHQRLPGLNTLAGGLFRLKNGPQLAPSPHAANGQKPAPADEAQQMHACDLDRCGDALPAASGWLFERLPRGRIAARRRAHYQRLHAIASRLAGVARPLFALDEQALAPYAMPLWVQASEADRVYQGLREAGCALFRWDRVWPGVPEFDADHGRLWQRQVVQMLCHQDLDDAALAHTEASLSRLL